jgi:hypothetical protein
VRDGGESGRSCGKEEQCAGGDLLHLLTLSGWHSPVFDIRDSRGVDGRSNKNKRRSLSVSLDSDSAGSQWLQVPHHFCTPLLALPSCMHDGLSRCMQQD